MQKSKGPLAKMKRSSKTFVEKEMFLSTLAQTHHKKERYIINPCIESKEGSDLGFGDEMIPNDMIISHKVINMSGGTHLLLSLIPIPFFIICLRFLKYEDSN